MEKLQLFNSKPPANYVAGLGRGAAGFTTRSDIGPARTVSKIAVADDDIADQKTQNPEDSDYGLFSSAEYDDDDRVADAVYNWIDQCMDSRRKHKREAKLKLEIENRRSTNPSIVDQFSDLKRKLSAMSQHDWETIPEIGDYRYSNYKKKKFQSFVPVPDTTLFEKAVREKQLFNSLDLRTMEADLTSIGEGRGTMLSLKLDKISDSVSGLTVIDPKGYLTDLNSRNNLTFDADVKKTRLLFKSITQTNPNHSPGWIAAAKLEEIVGNIDGARKFIKRGCDRCPKSEDVWMEACRLANPDEAKAVIAKGVKEIPNSVKLWLQASELEHDDDKKSRVLRKGLETVPDSVKLWEGVIRLEVESGKDDNARILLRRAVECCPLHAKFWLSVAKLETYDDAKIVLNQARKKLPNERVIWIAAAKLEEANGNASMVEKLIKKGIAALESNGVVIDREDWLKEAEVTEQEGSIATCQAIVRCTIGIGVEDEDRKRTWIADAEEFEKKGCIETARAIYAHTLAVFFTKKSVWLKAAQLEKAHGTRESLDVILRRAVSYMPQVEVFWLMGAKEKWLAGDVHGARSILEQAYQSNRNSEDILLAAFKLEFKNHEHERARLLLAKARESGVGTVKVWVKSAVLERELGNVIEERSFLDEGLKRFPSCPKLWLMLGQMEERIGKLEEAKKGYELGTKRCPKAVALWLSLAKVEERINGVSKARAVLTIARKKNPGSEEIWVASVEAESRHGNKKQAEFLMAKAIQECPKLVFSKGKRTGGS